MFSLNILIGQLTFTGKTRNILAVLLNGLIRKGQNHKKTCTSIIAQRPLSWN
jgi:hypothetical protein